MFCFAYFITHTKAPDFNYSDYLDTPLKACSDHQRCKVYAKCRAYSWTPRNELWIPGVRVPISARRPAERESILKRKGWKVIDEIVLLAGVCLDCRFFGLFFGLFLGLFSFKIFIQQHCLTVYCRRLLAAHLNPNGHTFECIQRRSAVNMQLLVWHS